MENDKRTSGNWGAILDRGWGWCVKSGNKWVAFRLKSSADAHLIAAAPEMLELLETIENDASTVPDWLWKRIQEVVQKAGGQGK